MTQYAAPLTLLLLASALTSYVATAIVRGAAQHIGLVDVPDDRKMHDVATPRLGGIAIIFGFGFPLLILAAQRSAAGAVERNLSLLLAVLASESLVVGLGIYDDLIGADAPRKFVVQFGAAAILVAFGFSFTEISIAGQVIPLGAFGAVVSLFWIVGVMNAINFIDGMDSLATVVSLTIAAAFSVIGILREDTFSLTVMIALTGSLIGFYPWNRPPAKIFMGDTGSLFIGLLLAAASIARPSKSPAALLIIGPMVALALPVLDTLIVMHQRFRGRGVSLAERIGRMFTADRRHIHHILVGRYGSDGKAIFWIWAMTLLFAISAVLTVVQSLKWFGYGSAAVALVLLVALRYSSRRVAVEDSDLQPD